MWKVALGFLAGIIVWFLLQPSSDIPNELMLKNFYQNYINAKNENAVSQFGVLVTSDKRVIIKSFQLNRCEKSTRNKVDYICIVTVQLDTPQKGVEKRDLEFNLKQEANGFKIILKQL